MPAPRIIVFGAGGPFSCLCLESLVDVATVAAVVVPRPRGTGLRRTARSMRQRWATRALRTIARRHRVPVVTFGSDLRAFDADLICVASFPHIISSDVRDAARLGAINVHSSLLPQHRGPDPIFWTYFDDDRTTGVTVHWMTDEVDAGDIIAQREIDLPRGIAGVELYARLTTEAAAAIATAVAQIGDGSATRTAQSDASPQPHPSQMTWRVDYDSWPAERVHHFLRGYSFRTNAMLADGAGTLHRIGDVREFVNEAHDRKPGTFVRDESDWLIFCRDGIVRTRAPRSRRR